MEITLEVNGRLIEAEKGETILSATESQWSVCSHHLQHKRPLPHGSLPHVCC